MTARRKGKCCRLTWGLHAFVVALGPGCTRERATTRDDSAPTDAGTRTVGDRDGSVAGAGADAAASLAAQGAAAGAASWSCPDGMVPIQGGEFWVGSTSAEGPPDERPRFQTRVARFCLDRTEVTARAYEACVQRGQCTKSARTRVTCTTGDPQRADHPINCVTWEQAERFCAARSARLPTEVEWEYAARGGGEQRVFSWGATSPDGRTCWKSARTCKVASYPAGAFGLFDMTGNVWEWTHDWYGPYPWPAQFGSRKVYRGGSWSRRFEKWLSPTLRNREQPHASGSHLGFRCAFSPPGTECPFGADNAGSCLHGVLTAACSEGKVWNGARCAKPGDALCRPGKTARPGVGCVSETPELPDAVPLDLSGVTATRAPEFDEDCRAHYAGRPRAYRYAGATHAARNAVSRAAGCKNRDVGVGWNSTCCP